MTDDFRAGGVDQVGADRVVQRTAELRASAPGATVPHHLPRSPRERSGLREPEHGLEPLTTALQVGRATQTELSPA
jgi:hypothetical protein